MGSFLNPPNQIVSGEKINGTDLNSWYQNILALFTAWTPYTPALTNITLGNGTLSGQYTQVGKFIVFRLGLTHGTTTSVTGAVAFGLPATALDINWTASALLWDGSVAANRIPGVCVPATTSVALYSGPINGGTGAGAVTATTPFTWASTDVMRAGGVYEAA